MIKDENLKLKVRKTVEKISENMHIVGNEPSLALYRIQEHCRKVLPLVVDRRAEVEYLQQDLQGKCYDLEYAVAAVKSIKTAEEPIENLHELLKNSIFLKQQLKFLESKRPKKATSTDSVYKRLSAHITLDIPDFSGVVKETTSRVESMMVRTNSTTTTASGSSTAEEANGAAVQSTSTSTTSTELQRSRTTLH